VPPLTPPDPPLSDGVVTLRAWRPEDRDAVVAALQDPEIPRWTTIPSPYGPAEYDAWLERQRTSDGLHLLVVDGQDRVVGAVGMQLTEAVPDIGYWCAAEHRGRGHTVRAVRLLRDHLRSLGHERIDIYVHHENVASQRVARAAGFEATGEMVAPDRLTDEPTYLRFTCS
jgi:RimJ/RimL family protein N-acetyltransferase